MAVCVEKLLDLVKKNAEQSDIIVIISGYTTPDIIEQIAGFEKETHFYYGMYRKSGLTKPTHDKLIELDSKFGNLTVSIVNLYHVHTKCYLFLKDGNIINALVGSANCSKDGLCSNKNSEMLVELNTDVLQQDEYLKSLLEYVEAVKEASVRCDDPDVVVSEHRKASSMRAPKGKFKQSDNPFVAFLPLFYFKRTAKGNIKKVVHEQGGLNWGLQSGHSKQGDVYAEAYIPIGADIVDNHMHMIPFFPSERQTTSGKATRKSDPVTVLWDDGVIMEMVFSGSGVERPTKGSRKPGEPYHEYPKNFTSSIDGGGAKLGEYLRKRMNVGKRHRITIDDLKKYGREYIELTYIHDGYYEADFSGKPFETTVE